MAEESKKDLTSLVELSEKEIANNPFPTNEQTTPPDLPPVPQLTDADFESLDTLTGQESSTEAPPPLSIELPEFQEEPAAPLDLAPPEFANELDMAEIHAHPHEPEGLVHSEQGAEEVDAPPVDAPPAGLQQAIKSKDPATQKQDLSQVRKFGEKLAIGTPKIDASPAFSLLIKGQGGPFDEKTRKAIENVIANEDYGIRIEDVAVQLDSGKLLVPQISEFAAITLAQRLRDVVDTIEVDLAAEIFKGSATEMTVDDESPLLDAEHFESHHEEVRDIGAEPASEKDLFSTNLNELAEFKVTRILSAVTASEIVPAEVAENAFSREFERVTEKLTQELVSRAFQLGAHGVIGINFSLRPIDAYKDPHMPDRDDQGHSTFQNIRRAYRLMGTGTAVRVRKRKSFT